MSRARRFSLLLLVGLVAGLFLRLLAPPAGEPQPGSTAPAHTLGSSDAPISAEAAPGITSKEPGAEAPRAAIPDPPARSPLDALLDRAALLAEYIEPIPDGRVRRLRVWETDGHHPFVRTEEILQLDAAGRESVRSRVAMVADHLLVQLDRPSPDRTTHDGLAGLGVELFDAVTDDGLFRARIADYHDPLLLSLTLERLRDFGPVVRFSEPDYLTEAHRRLPNDPRFGEQGELDRTRGPSEPNSDIDAPEAWTLRTSADGLIVAVVDSGIRLTHEDLRVNLWTNPGEIPGNEVDDDGNGHIDDLHGFDAVTKGPLTGDPDGHGTLVAGVIGAAGNNGRGVAGVAWNVRLMGARFLDQTGTGATSDAIEAIDYATANGARVINNSWGGSGRSTSLQEALQRAGARGALIVSSAGNERASLAADPVYPAAYSLPHQIVVAAVDETDGLASYSNFDAALVHLAAPGRALSTGAGSDTDYASFSGTSAAAPYVSGGAALLLAHLPPGNPATVVARLLATIEPRSSLASYVATGGRFNLHRALADLVDAPDNDAFANATELVPGKLRQGVLVRAGSETGEPGPDGFRGRTVWYRLQTERNTFAVLTLRTSGFDGGFALYQGDRFAELVPIRTSPSTGTGRTVVQTATLSPGQSYRIQVDSVDGGTGPFTLSLALAPANDAFAEALPLDGEAFTIGGTTILATREREEPSHHPQAAGRSVWYRWTAPVTGTLLLVSESADGASFPALYAGDLLPSLTRPDVALDRDVASRLLVPVVADRTYRIAVDAQNPAGSAFDLWGRYVLGPRILGQPRDQAVPEGGTAAFNVTLSGGTNPVYQWSFEGDPIPGANASELVLTSVSPEDTGGYHVTIATAGVTLTSRTATLAIGNAPPVILVGPRSTTVPTGGSTAFTVLTRPTEGVTFEWRRNGALLVGQTGPTLSILNAETADTGFYEVTARSEFGSSTADLFFLHVATGSPYAYFSWPKASGNPDRLVDIRWISDRWVVAGVGGFIGFSFDGSSWQFSTVHGISTINLDAVVRRNGLWVAGGSQGIFGSTDLIEWRKISTGYDRTIQMAIGAGRIVRASIKGLHHSADGAAWTPAAGLPTDLFHGVGFDGQRFLASHGSGLYTSANGVDWAPAPRAGATGFGLLRHSPTLGWWMRDQSWNLLRSGDGENWSKANPSWTQSRTIAIDPEDGAVYLLDPEGLWTWSGTDWQHLSVQPQWAIAFAVNNGRFLGLAGSQIAPLTAQGPPYSDQKWWTGANLVTANDRFYAFASSEVHESRDGFNWSSSSSGGVTTFGEAGLAYGNGRYVSVNAIGDSPATLTTTPEYRNQVVFGAGYFVAVTGNRIHRSEDGIDWQPATADLPDNVDSLAFQGGVFLAGGGNFIARSIDGLAWTFTQRSGLALVRYFAFGSGRHMAASSDGTIHTSTDAITWQTGKRITLPNILAHVEGLAFHRDRFLAIYFDTILESSDGTSWSIANESLAALDPTALRVAGDVLIVVNYYGPPAVLGASEAARHYLEFVEPRDSEQVVINAVVPIRLVGASPADPFVTIRIAVNGVVVDELGPAGGETRFFPEHTGSYRITVEALTVGGSSVLRERTIRVGPGSTSRPLPEGFPMNDLAVFQGAFYGAGPGGIVYVSLDGLDWLPLQTPCPSNLKAFQVAAPGICAVDEEGGILASLDGVSWKHQSGLDARWPVEPTRPGFFALPGGQRGWLSHDGSHWFSALTGLARGQAPPPRVVPPELHGQLYSVYLGRPGSGSDEVRLPVGEGIVGLLPWKGQTIALTPWHVLAGENGRDWVDISPPRHGERRFFRIVEAGGLLVVHEGDTFSDRTGAIHLSTDGLQWQSTETDRTHLETVFWKGWFFSVTPFDVRRSTDGLIWERVLDLPYSHGQSTRIVAGPAGVVVLRNREWDGTQTTLATTGDGDTWTVRNSEITVAAGTPIETPETLFAVVEYPRAVLRERPDRSWESFANTTLDATTIYGNGRFLRFDPYRSLHLSEDGINWVEATIPPYAAEDVSAGTDPNLRIIFDRERHFWLTNILGVVARSTNGADWTDVRGALPVPVWKIVGFKGRQAGIGQGIWMSADDGLSWTRRDSEAEAMTFTAIAATSGSVAVIGYGLSWQSGVLLVSDDGTTWERGVLPENHATTLVATAGRFYVKGASLWESADGRTWIHLGNTASGSIAAVADRLLFFGKGYARELTETDLAMEGLSTPGGIRMVGDAIEVSTTLRNVGFRPTPARSVQLEILLSTQPQVWGVPADGRLQTGRLEIALPALGPGASADFAVPFQLSPELRPGGYHLAARLVSTSAHPDANGANDLAFAAAGLRIEIPLRKLDITVVGEGRVSSSRPRFELAHGQTVILEPESATGHEFTGWDGDVPAGGDVLTLLMDRDRSVTARFVPRKYRLEVNTIGEGEVGGVPEGELIPYGQAVSLHATPGPRWTFLGWRGDFESSDPGLGFPMARDRAVRAHFGQTFSQWVLDHLADTPEADRSPDADADRDGFANAAEFVLGTCPEDGADVPQIALSRVGPDIRAGIHVSRTAAGMAPVVDLSHDLVAWTRLSTPSLLIIESAARLIFEYQFTSDQPVFLRVGTIDESTPF